MFLKVEDEIIDSTKKEIFGSNRKLEICIPFAGMEKTDSRADWGDISKVCSGHANLQIPKQYPIRDINEAT